MSWEVLNMKSGTSCFDRGLARNLWRRSWPLWAAYLAALLFLGPLDLLRQSQRPSSAFVGGVPALSYSLAGTGEFAMFLSLLFGVIAAMAVFGFLYGSRGCGMVNSFPLTRGAVFWTCVLTGLLPLAVSELIAALLCLPFCAKGWLSPEIVLVWLGTLALSMLFFYGFAVFCAQLTGSLLVLPAVYTVLNFAVYVAEYAVRNVLSHVVYGLDAYGVSRLALFSPFVGMVGRYRVTYTDWPELVAVTGMGTLALYALCGLALLLPALALYRRRAMERAGDTVAVPALKPVFQVCMCFGTAFVFTEFVWSLPGVNAQGRQAALAVLGLLLVGAFLGWFAARMLIDRSLRVFRGHWRGFLLCAALLIALVGACEFDLFGYERRVPDAAEVESVVMGRELEEPENIAAAVALHRGLIANKAYHETVPAEYGDWYEGGEDAWALSRNVGLIYRLKDGRTLTRRYRILGDSETVRDPNSDLCRLEALYNSREAIQKRCSFDFELTPERVVWANLELYYPEQDGRALRPETWSLSGEEMLDLWRNGIRPDAAEGHVSREKLYEGDGDWDYVNAELHLMAVEDPVAFEQSGNSSFLMRHMTLRFETDSAHSLAWIRDFTGAELFAMDDASAVLGGVG